MLIAVLVRQPVADHHEQHLAGAGALANEERGVADRSAEPRVATWRQRRQATLSGVVVAVVEIVYPQEPDRLAPARVEAVRRDPVAELIERCGELCRQQPLLVEHAATFGRLAGRAGRIEQHQHAEIVRRAPLGLVYAGVSGLVRVRDGLLRRLPGWAGAFGARPEQLA